MHTRWVLAITFTLALASVAHADNLSVKLAADGTATLKLPRNLVDGQPTVTVVFKLPAGWVRDSKSPEYAQFVPKGARWGRPSIEVNVQMDNLEPAETAERAKKASEDFKATVPGGDMVSVLTDARVLADNHAHLVSIERDSKAAQLHSVQTACFLPAEGKSYVVKLSGFGEIQDKKLVPEFEKACASLRLKP
jgi:hypothetical protein